MSDMFKEQPSSAAVPSPRAAKRAGSRNSVTAATTPLRHGGAVSAALGKALADQAVRSTKAQRAQSVLPDVLDALRQHPGGRLQNLWPILKDLDPQDDGPAFRRTLARLVKETLQETKPVKSGAVTPQPRAVAEPTHALEPPLLPTTAAADRLAEDLRTLRAPGF